MSPLENMALIWLDIDLRLALYPSVGRLLSELAWVGNRSQMTNRPLTGSYIALRWGLNAFFETFYAFWRARWFFCNLVETSLFMTWNDSIAAWPDSLNHLNRFISSIESIQYFEGLCMWLLILSEMLTNPSTKLQKSQPDWRHLRQRGTDGAC